MVGIPAFTPWEPTRNDRLIWVVVPNFTPWNQNLDFTATEIQKVAFHFPTVGKL